MRWLLFGAIEMWKKVKDVMPPVDMSVVVRKKSSKDEFFELIVRVEEWATPEDLINYGIHEWRSLND